MKRYVTVGQIMLFYRLNSVYVIIEVLACKQIMLFHSLNSGYIIIEVLVYKFIKIVILLVKVLKKFDNQVISSKRICGFIILLLV